MTRGWTRGRSRSGFLQIEREAQVERLQHFGRWCLADIAALQDGTQVLGRAGVIERGKGDALDGAVRVEPGTDHERWRRSVLFAGILDDPVAEAIGDRLVGRDPLFEPVFDQLGKLRPGRRRLFGIAKVEVLGTARRWGKDQQAEREHKRAPQDEHGSG
ncbi:hypothetical protein chiPu_0033562, partial [Chiloscyllium punctatum]|nr:hypothetical protein [Chiloscyllium punctatum]